MKTKYLTGILAIALGAMAMTSCNDDDTYDVYGNPNNLVYVNIAGDFPEGMPKNSFVYTIYHTPVGPIVASEPGDIEIDVMCTKNAPSDMQVTLEAAPDMAVEGYSTLPANSGIKVTLESSTLTIPAGKNRSSEKAKVHVDLTNANWSVLTDKAYLVPIRIVAASGAQPSQSMVGAAYIGVLTEVKTGMLNPAATSIDGEAITDTDGWTGTWKAPAAGKEGSLDMAKLLDNNQWSNAYFVANHADKVNEEVINTFDLGKEYDIKGLQLRYYYIYYTIKDATLETSLDGIEYTDQGTLSWSENGIDRYFAFWASTKVRYIRVTTHSFYGGTGEGTALSDLILYK
ncbi:DUF1735 domain-containing protein [uncultured Muribaculum sp.]|uniref:BT_3987 domain-containing protein n=1 Tax=uncultured Muribaculum sp. TaxID=1918613 RepID=UPI0025D6F07C|nr:DUF1735 domain-containing protein [uncultured Muribaculum sp.]